MLPHNDKGEYPVANIKDKRWAAVSGRPDLVMRHIEIPVKWDDEPDRPAVVIIPVSKLPQLMRALARLHSKATGTAALMSLLDSDISGGEGPDRT